MGLLLGFSYMGGGEGGDGKQKGGVLLGFALGWCFGRG